ncbi:MAG TPA: TadE/TadG family type IV pilus assembly protein [Gemmataceae bacterium]
MRTSHRPAGESRTGTAAVELAVLLPLLAFLLVIGVDFARVFYYTVSITNAAEAGALYGSQSPEKAADTAGIQQVAMRDLTGISPPPTVTSWTESDAEGFLHLTVRVQYQFSTVTNYPGVPSSPVLERICKMRVQPTAPKPGTYSGTNGTGG